MGTWAGRIRQYKRAKADLREVSDYWASVLAFSFSLFVSAAVRMSLPRRVILSK